jgi:hypothetical protein
MPEVESGVAQLLPTGDIDPCSKRLEIGLHDHSPVQAWRELTRSPARMSVAVHELAHFHSLVNIVGVVFTARAFFQQFFYEQLFAYAETGRPGIEKLAAAYLNTLFQRKRMIELWTPLLEGLAVYAQTSLPCPEIDTMSEPAGSLLVYGAALNGLDPSQPELTRKSILAAVAEGVKSSARLDAGGMPLAARIELGGEPGLLPYFLGHAYVRALHDRFCRAMPELECPELFTNFMIRVLRGSARRTLIGHGVRPDQEEAVVRLYHWIDLVEAASPQLLRKIYGLPEAADAIDALICQDAYEPLMEQWRLTRDVTQYVGDLLPAEWQFFTEMLEASDFEDASTSTDDLADHAGFERVPGETLESMAASAGFDGSASGLKSALGVYVESTLRMNVTSGGVCRLLGRVASAPEVCVLDVDGHRWQLHLKDATESSLGFDVGALPTVDVAVASAADTAPTSDGGLELEISSYLLWGVEWPFILELRVRDGPAHPFLARINRPPGADRAVLEQSDRRFREGHLAYQSLRDGLEIGDNVVNCAAILRERGLGSLADDLLSNLPHQEQAMAQLRRRWVRAILGQLLDHKVGDEVVSDLTDNHLSSGLLTLPRVPATVADAYSAPAVYEGPGASDIITILRVVNESAERRYGKRLFDLQADGVVRYLGLWAH